jgi:hypothetical protein
MFWVGMLIGLFLGVSIGLVLAGMKSSVPMHVAAGAVNAEAVSRGAAGLDDSSDITLADTSGSERTTYLDRYPHA